MLKAGPIGMGCGKVISGAGLDQSHQNQDGWVWSYWEIRK